MKLSNQELQEIINGNQVGDDWPFIGGTPDDVEVHLRMIMQSLNASYGIEVEGEFDHYGSGYASYVHLFCKRPKEASTYQRDGRTWTDGIAVYLSRLTPIAVLGAETRTVFERGSSHGFLDANSIDQLPDETWVEEKTIIESILVEEGYQLASREEMEARLPFKAKIKSAFDDKSVFDAVFYWED